MEEYLQNMKTLRSQMNDVEDLAAKISVEEQTQITSIHTMELDLNLAKSETRTLKEEIERMVKAKGQICSQILDKQKKIASLEADSSTLSQTLELIQQEKLSLSAKLKEKRAYYIKVVEELNAKLQEQQDWINARKLEMEVRELRVVQGKFDEQTGEIEGKSTYEIHQVTANQEYEQNKEYKDLRNKLELVKANLEEIKLNKSKLISENRKVEQSIQQLKCRANSFPPELGAMDIKALEEEHQALLSDKAGETEYLQSLQNQIEQLKGISHVVKCECGEEYVVQMMESCA
ncbi:hypothetical protein BVC80_8357g8 [Macleaya cordata]|uniref:Uncharacterized protein n=1 Tax=Macleaya cordata TaxID=56857 RepID=A0A200QFN5_MACCD|nr:hypothetical protein BVC80_8357g8 [Macleaya cordata]